MLNPEKPVPPYLAQKFQQCFAPGVIRVDPRTNQVSVDEKNMRRDTVSREVLRHPEFQGCVELKRVRDFFLCESSSIFLSPHTPRFPPCPYHPPPPTTVKIESESFYPPERLLPEAIKVMRGKIATIRRAAEALLADSDALGGDVGESRAVGEEDVVMMDTQ